MVSPRVTTSRSLVRLSANAVEGRSARALGTAGPDGTGLNSPFEEERRGGASLSKRDLRGALEHACDMNLPSGSLASAQFN